MDKIYTIIHYRNGFEEATEKGTFEDLLHKHQVDINYVQQDKVTNINKLVKIMNIALTRIGLYREHYHLV